MPRELGGDQGRGQRGDGRDNRMVGGKNDRLTDTRAIEARDAQAQRALLAVLMRFEVEGVDDLEGRRHHEEIQHSDSDRSLPAR